jgi:hypothetical protein
MHVLWRANNIEGHQCLPAQRPPPHITLLTLLLLTQLKPAMRWRQAGKFATVAVSCMVGGSGIVSGQEWGARSECDGGSRRHGEHPAHFCCPAGKVLLLAARLTHLGSNLRHWIAVSQANLDT